ncbi:MAG TPA: ATP-binding protein, partial [Opitutus sp.]|nr:ATP-binding protein [Opitutus sp.]
VFWNVLKNAVKFTPQRGAISVTSRTENAQLHIDISDTGIGMTEDEIGRSFKSFSQGDHALRHSTHRFGGLGLGLAISRMLMELHGGEISARSAGRGRGATFCIRLPVVDPPKPENRVEEPANVTNGAEQTGEGTRILLVEDHEPTRMAVTRLLGRRGYRVKSATNAAEAIRLAAASTFDLVISDIGLPDIDGYALMRQLRERHRLRGVALSGYGMEDDIARGRAAGFEEHLTKPIDIKKLQAALERMRACNDRS